VLFSDLSGYTALNERLDPEEVARILDEIKEAAVHAIEAAGGTVNQFVGDEVMAFFGIPVANDDDPRRAVEAAIELHRFVRELDARLELGTGEPLRMHSGIHTGLVVAQLRDRREGVFAATGDTVNTAARLLSAAGSDEILVGPDTNAQIAPWFETTSVGALELKGKAQPLPTHRVTRAERHRSRFEVVADRGLSPLTARVAELEELERSLAGSAGGARIALLQGDAGVGKSRLAHEFCERAAERGCTILRGSCRASGRVVPYHPLVEALRRHLGVREGDAPKDIAERTVAAADALGEDVRAHVPVLLHLLSVESEAHRLPPEITPEELPRAIPDALAGFVGALARAGTVLVHVEDWHWADEASAALLPLLARLLRNAPVLLLVDQRPAPVLLGDEVPIDAIDVEPFGGDATRALVCARLGASRVPGALISRIEERAAGNPFFIEEICTSLEQSGALERRGETLVLSVDAADLDIPETVQAVLQSRIDQLEPYDRDLLRVASVIGPEVPCRVIERVSPGDAIDEQLARLERLNLMQHHGTDSERSYAFKHVTVQEVAYDTILRRERAEIHRRVGDVLESLHAGERIGEHVETLAHHYRLGGVDEKALPYLEQAAWKAAGSYALAQAREHFRAAIDLMLAREESDEDARRRIDLTLRWAEVCIFGPSLEQIALLEGARDRAMALGDPERIVTALYWICWIYYAVGEHARAIEELERLVALVRPAGDDAVTGMMLLALGHCYAAARDARVLPTLEEGLGLRHAGAGEQVAPDAHELDPGGALEAFSLSQCAFTRMYSGDTAAARAGFAQAMERVQQSGSRSTEGSVWITWGLARLVESDWSGAIAAAGEARGIAEQMRAPYHLDTADAIEGYARFQLGAGDDALEQLTRGIEGLEKTGAFLSMSLSLASHADALAEAGQSAEARRQAEASLARREHGDRLGDDLALRVLARLDAREGRSAAFEQRHAELLELARMRGSAREEVLAHVEALRAGVAPAGFSWETAVARFAELDLPGHLAAARVLAHGSRG
jgi:class 3 adenylate cyclase/tetratricopeptide (TPR) repeat protein